MIIDIRIDSDDIFNYESSYLKVDGGNKNPITNLSVSDMVAEVHEVTMMGISERYAGLRMNEPKRINIDLSAEIWESLEPDMYEYYDDLNYNFEL